ncbi:hypothetical protein GQ457_07G019110 [Hibiscus cannabinus]
MHALNMRSSHCFVSCAADWVMVRLLHLRQEFVFQWDLSLRAPPRRAAGLRYKWLIEEGSGQSPKLWNYSRGNDGTSLAVSQYSIDNQGGNKEPILATNFVHAGKSTLVPIVGPILSQTPGLYLNSENFASDGEDSPIEHVDGLKRPCIHSDAIGVSLTKDSAGAHDGSTSEPNPYISAGLVNPASRSQ